MSEKLINQLYENSIEYIVHWRKHLKEYFWAILIVLTIRANIGVFYRIPTVSMVPTFRVGDMLVANRFYTGLKLPFTDELEGFRLPAIKDLEVGDVVIFLGPREEIFHNLILKFPPSDLENSPQKEFLRYLNRISKIKRVIYPVENYPNGSVNKLKNLLKEEKNYIFTGLEDGLVRVHLHEKIYLENLAKIEKLFTLYASQIQKHTMTYSSAEYRGFLFHFFSVPIAGISMIMNVVMDTPMMIFYKILITSLAGREALLFYPNRWTDQSKEYVKRLIAKEGDKVEIKNKRVYVNDQLLEWDIPFASDPFNSQFAISKEMLPHSSKEKGDGYKHPIRLSGSVIKPSFDFDSKLWPYEPEGMAAGEFRDFFGPIIVPKDHYFMMGDNRDESLDSRYFGPVPKWTVKGTPMMIFYPWGRRGVID